MASRKYTKRSDYWKKFEKNFQYPNNPYESLAGQSDTFEPKLVGDSFYDYTSEAYSRGGGTGGTTDSRRNSIAVQPKLYAYKQYSCRFTSLSVCFRWCQCSRGYRVYAKKLTVT